MRKTFITSVLTLFCAVSYAQESTPKKTWSLKECVDYAMENNVNVLSNRIDVELADVSAQQAKLNYIPTVGANLGYNLNTGRALDPTTYSFLDNQVVNNLNGSVSLSTALFGGMQKYNSLHKSKIDYLKSVQTLQKFKNDISLSIAAYYLEIIYNKELIVTLEKQLETLRANVEQMRKLVEAGSATRGQLLDLEAQLAGEEYSLVDGENKLQLSIINLCQLLEIKNFNGFGVSIPALPSLEGMFPRENPDAIFDMAQNLPEIKAAEYALKSAEYDIKLAKGRYYPTLNFSAGYSSAFSDTRKKPSLDSSGNPIIIGGNIQYERYKFWNQVKDNAGSAITLGLNIPIFTQLSVRNNVRRSKLMHKKANYALSDEKIKLYKSIQQAYTDAEGAIKKYDAAVKRVVSNEESIKYMQEKFNVGTVTVTDYNIAKNNLIISEAQMLQAKYDYIFKIQVLLFYMGTPIGQNL